MNIFKIFILFFISSTILNATILIDDKTKQIDILSKSQFYIDNKKLSINDISDVKFESSNKKKFSFGYNPDFYVWLKFTLVNTTNENKEFILEYNNQLTTDVLFFENKKIVKEGLFFDNKNRKTVNPIFTIHLNPNHSKTYYIRATSEITTLIVDLKLWDIQKFYEKEILHQLMLSLFFGAMLALFAYNLSIFFFTKDISYFYYVLYIAVMVSHQLLFVGIGNLYIFDKETLIKIFELAPLIVVLPIFTLALFTKSFLKLEQYPIHNKILNILLILIPINIMILLYFEELAKYRNHITIIVLTYLMYVTVFSFIKKNKHAKFILLGWVILFISGVLMILSSIGVINIYEYIPYLPEVAIVTESIILSVALSNRIKTLQEDNDNINKQMILQKENEKERLEEQVTRKTKDLNSALEERELLLKELNHRVKNNMQTIISLIRLQSDKVNNEVLDDILKTIQNRIAAMSYLHELLYTQNDMTFIDTNHYFRLICEEIQASYNKDITISLNIDINITIEDAMYCGLILNELITNTFKYAYPNNKKGEVFISLRKDNDINELIVCDKGIGFKGKSNSLGLIIVENLVVRQLKGEIKTNSNNGIEHIMKWKTSNEN